MKRESRIRRVARRRRGVLTFEWILIATVLVIGIIAGLSAVRSSLVNEYQALTESICDTDVCEEMP